MFPDGCCFPSVIMVLDLMFPPPESAPIDVADVDSMSEISSGSSDNDDLLSLYDGHASDTDARCTT